MLRQASEQTSDITFEVIVRCAYRLFGSFVCSLEESLVDFAFFA